MAVAADAEKLHRHPADGADLLVVAAGVFRHRGSGNVQAVERQSGRDGQLAFQGDPVAVGIPGGKAHVFVEREPVRPLHPGAQHGIGGDQCGQLLVDKLDA